jgi:hypothetical protein
MSGFDLGGLMFGGVGSDGEDELGDEVRQAMSAMGGLGMDLGDDGEVKAEESASDYESADELIEEDEEMPGPPARKLKTENTSGRLIRPFSPPEDSEDYDAEEEDEMKSESSQQHVATSPVLVPPNSKPVPAPFVPKAFVPSAPKPAPKPRFVRVVSQVCIHG